MSNGGKKSLAMASTDLPSLKPDTSLTPRMLTPSEIEWLRQNKRENNKYMLETAKWLPDQGSNLGPAD